MVVTVGSITRKSPHTMYVGIGRRGGGGVGLNLRDRFLELAIFNKEYRTYYSKLYRVYSILYPDVVKCIDNNICPFCNKRFRNMKTLKIHLTKNYNGCANIFWGTIQFTVYVYSKIPKSVCGRYYINGKSYGKNEFRKVVMEVVNNL